MKLFLQLLSSILQSAEVWFKKHALQLFQYCSVLFDNRIELTSDRKAIVEMTRWNISPQLHAKVWNCQTTPDTNSSILRKLLAKYNHFSLGTVWKYSALYVNKNRLRKPLSFKMLVHKYNILLLILLKLMHTSHDFIATKTCPSCEFSVVFGQLRV